MRRKDGRGFGAVCALVTALYAVPASAASADSIQLKPGPSPGQTAHRANLRNTAFCEIAVVLGASSNNVAQFYGATAAGVECPPDKFAAIDPKALADELGASSVLMSPTPQSARRYWVADEIWDYGVGETIDFHGVKAAWTASMSPELLSNMISTPYTAAEMRQESERLYAKGAKVFLIHAPDGKTWVMQSYATEVDAELTFDRLSELDNALKLPDGYRFEVATLRQDLTIDSRRAGGLAHVLRDELHNVYAGCGFDAACSYIPGSVIRPPRHRPRGRRQ
ncbi:MAG TPA: hypothetical protein VEK35_10960 [Roseiarcus sp.]|nr:hypothetical protein [Roseiarcus sp.]